MSSYTMKDMYLDSIYIRGKNGVRFLKYHFYYQGIIVTLKILFILSLKTLITINQFLSVLVHLHGQTLIKLLLYGTILMLCQVRYLIFYVLHKSQFQFLSAHILGSTLLMEISKMCGHSLRILWLI